MEHASFDLVRQGHQEEAKRLLFSQEYEEQKSIYADAITECKRAVERRVDQQLRHHTNRALVGLALTLAALIALGSGWGAVLRVVRQNVAERRILLSKLEDAVRARDEFLSIASHELKTPLTTLKLQVESLSARVRRERQGAAGARDFEAKLSVVERQVNRLSSLIDELLDTSRITSGYMKLVLEYDVDLSEIIRDALSRFKDQLARASCDLQVRGIERPILGRWDRLRLDQVVSNLISNALKYGAGRPIEVEADATDLLARLTVRDHGIGISPDKQSIIFLRFERAVPEREYGGFGLGLWIVREIAAAMGGGVSVTSQLGEGATFQVTLPRHAAERSDVSEESPVSANHVNPTATAPGG
jgi:signal transduction histidine kinase